MAEEPDARLIAGGQTLVPMLAMRLARPSLLIDISRLEELKGIARVGDYLEIGACTRQSACEADIVATEAPLLAKALPWIGHPPTRARGTVGGSLANADPSAEIPLVFATLGGIAVIRDLDGESEIGAEEFFIGPMLTTIAEGGCVVRVRFPVWENAVIGAGFHEVSARRSDFAFAAAAAQVAIDADGRCARVALGIGGVGDFPQSLDVTCLVGEAVSTGTIRDAVVAAMEDVDSFDDLHATSAYRKRVGTEFGCRALGDAFAQAASQQVHL